MPDPACSSHSFDQVVGGNDADGPGWVLFGLDDQEALDALFQHAGGGKSGQCGAIAHGASRALVVAEEDLKPALKKAGLLSRDARMKEGKKPGQPGARKRFQFSKR